MDLPILVAYTAVIQHPWYPNKWYPLTQEGMVVTDGVVVQTIVDMVNKVDGPIRQPVDGQEITEDSHFYQTYQ